MKFGNRYQIVQISRAKRILLALFSDISENMKTNTYRFSPFFRNFGDHNTHCKKVKQIIHSENSKNETGTNDTRL
jgi:hypothetical protein